MTRPASGSRAAMGEPVSNKPPWWRWYEPPRWFPDWLHMLACTHCRGISRYVRKHGYGKVSRG